MFDLGRASICLGYHLSNHKMTAEDMLNILGAHGPWALYGYTYAQT